MNNFNNKVAVITGAGGGIGREVALQLAREGCHLALADVNQQGLDETAELLQPICKKSGVKVSCHIVDVTDRSRMESLPEEVIGVHGAVNLLVNNAGITLQSSFEDLSIEHWELVLGINLWGVIYGTKAFLPYLKEQGKKGPDNAHIINMSSLAGFIGMPNQSSYCATKAAVRAISETLWAELHMDNIGVTCVHPGAIKTNILNAHLDKAGNPANAAAIVRTVDKFAMDTDKAVAKMLNAVKKNKQRVVIGTDSHLIEKFKRLLPSAIHKPFAKMFAKEQLARTE
ncbi:SDR family NAD(P)-dependent oxidoreductase [Endozoicomonas sp.]|uniref:SDR family NAD(P)-dependent oxidoreductase n=1 Tax=Endozoicomonas sp. TaxID=1892382 RepID=UPI002885D49A|nr:SDR family NAD(P)-dependent oxidoreductase [Endozoicomonas sp.]